MFTTGKRFYRVSIKSENLYTTANQVVTKSESPTALQEWLKWENPSHVEYLKTGFKPQENASELLDLIKGHKAQAKARQKRQNTNFQSLLAPRKGIMGWIQNFFDQKELSQPIGYQVFEWLHRSYRLGILISLHDSLLSHAVAGEAKEVDFEEYVGFLNPVTQLVINQDIAAAKNLIKNLISPISKVDSKFIVDGIAGNVIYQPKVEFAYYCA
jgi:hypothetical protein